MRRIFRTTAGKIGLVVVTLLIAVAVVGATQRQSSSQPKAERLASKQGPTNVMQGPDWVKAENAKPGSDAWNLDSLKRTIQGFADHTSASPGDKVNFFVSTPAPNFVVEAYRMGFYQGHRGRLVWTSPQLNGIAQVPPTQDATTHMGEAHWKPSFELVVNHEDWLPGTYLFKLEGADSGQSYVPLTIRDDTSHAPLVVINSVTTWQAYNTWSGCSLYECPGRAGAFRAVEVSFDRPLVNGEGAGDFLGLELPLISLVEELGLEVTYWTDIDLHERAPQLMNQHKALISLGHDEYYSTAMRDAMDQARDGGINIAFLGANAMYRHIRLEDSLLGANRRMINYRSTKDPIYSTPQRGETTVEWRSPPSSRPESATVGIMYECAPMSAPMHIVNSSNWIFEGSGVTDGENLPKLVGEEYDRYFPLSSTPPNLEILAHSPLKCRNHASYADMTYYSAASGSGVFASGTTGWVAGLEGFDMGARPDNPAAKVKAITTNILRAFSEGPAGAAHPSVANVSTYYGKGAGITAHKSRTQRNQSER